ncbi:hypothetical protein QQS21_009166 [Conoideocrella luteorostrata]|uniref:Probable aspartate--tRNA ligase, cytoplasmic n=1 Tax=Conoideocrella luteorostrata TaxID=1105319 RepID=A0AAJ0CIB2_9HYPO|nr:hypothetical protein QQS21_009166 [Conoideocrella luteorostrata]
MEPETSTEPSKKSLKKLQNKEKRKAVKAEKRAEFRTKPEPEHAASAPADVDYEKDPAKDNYGEVKGKSFSKDAIEVDLRSLDESYKDKTVIVRAWIQSTRGQSSGLIFVDLRKGGNWTIQGVVGTEMHEETPAKERPLISTSMIKWIRAIPPESFVVVEANVKLPAKELTGSRVTAVELGITKCFVIASAPARLGLDLETAGIMIQDFNEDPKVDKSKVDEAKVDEAKADEAKVDKATVDKSKTKGLIEKGTKPPASMLTHLENIAIHKRAPVQQAIADIRVEAKKLFRSYLEGHRFKEFEPPCLIGAASESGSEVFRLAYFGQDAFLAQSPQFYKQFEIAGGRERVFCIGPVFRAEKSNTPRHMTEFTGLDLEMEIQNSYTEVLDVLEGVLLHILRGLQERCAEEIETVRLVYESKPLLLPESGKVLRLTFAEAQKLLREGKPDQYSEVKDDEDMSTQQEKDLGALVREKFNTDFFVIDKFPETARPFYAKLDDDEDNVVGKRVRVTNAFDIFLRGQEILSGGQRINDPVELEKRIIAKELNPESPGIKEYVSVFRQGGVPPHGGGGIGLDRVVAWFLQLPSVQLAAYYPRTPKRLMP